MIHSDFRTVFRPHPGEPLSLRRPWLMMGSCFTDNIGAELRRRMVDVRVNPAGTLFNPQSIANVIGSALDGAVPEYEQHGTMWDSWLLPSEFSSPDRAVAQAVGMAAFDSLRTALKEAGVMIFTFGTAIIYSLARPPFTVVSNCHKQPADGFFRDMLPVEAVVACWDRLIERIRQTNPDVRIIFTVSPVRHLKEGFHANTLSKSTLHLAIAALTHLHPACEYFPAYEIVNDDLRDYRFYADDMQHPSLRAVRYIYDIFEETYLSDADRSLLSRAEKLRRRLDHRPLHPGTPDAVKFAAESDRLLSLLTADAPFLRP